jgi:hypothetical protein
MGAGDALARGAKSAQFSTGGKTVSQMQWDYMMMSPKKFFGTYKVTKKQYEAAVAIAEKRLARK